MAAQDPVENILEEASPQIVALAKNIVAERFRFIKKPDIFIKRLARLNLERVVRELIESPEKYTKHPQVALAGTWEPLDPLDLLRREHQLPALPQVIIQLQTAMGEPNTSAEDLASIISRDPSVTAFLLRMVNSAFYSLPAQIDTISRAVTVIGVGQLSTLAMGTSVMALFNNIPDTALDMQEFWKHSVACAIIARRLCRMTGKGDPERAFIAGLLHDIGLLILLQAEPEKTIELLHYIRGSECLLWQEEQRLLGFDHATLGGMLLRKWNFPFVLVAAVLEHHQPKADQKEAEPRLVHCAEVIATGLGLGSSGEKYVTPPNTEIWESLNLEPERFDEMVADLDEELEDAFAILM